jgi:hypothetical protein
MTLPEKHIGSFTDRGTGFGVEVVVSGEKTKSMGLVLKLPEGEVEAVIGRLRSRYPDGKDVDASTREEWMRSSSSYAILIGSTTDSYMFPATQSDKGNAEELWKTTWSAVKEVTGKDLSTQSKSQIMRLAKDALKHMSYGAALG